MAWTGKNKKGKTVTLLNPSEKGRKYANELKTGVRITNNGIPKVGENGKPIKLGKTGKEAQARAYRSGYLQTRKDSAKAWKSKRKK